MPRIRIPLQGMIQPRKTKNPLQASGKFKTLMNWVVDNGVLRLQDGFDELQGTITGTTDNNLLCVLESETQPAGDDGYSAFWLLYDRANTSTTEVYRWWSGGGTGATSLVGDLGGSASYRIPFAYWDDGVILGHGSGAAFVTSSAIRQLGVDAPSTASSGTASTGTGLTGVYSLVYTYVNSEGNEGNPSDASGNVSVTNTSIVWTIPAAPAGKDISYVRLYRTVQNGSAYLYLTQLSANTASTQTYEDANLDAALGDEAEYNNDTPPASIDQILTTPNRVYLLNNNKVYASKFDNETGEPNIDAYPADWAVTVYGAGVYWRKQCYAIEMLHEQLYAFTGAHTARISGEIGVNPLVTKVFDWGTLYYGGVCKCEATVNHKEVLAIICSDRKIRIWDGAEDPVIISDDVEGLLARLFYYAEKAIPFIFDPINDRLLIVNNDDLNGQSVRGMTYNFANKSWALADWHFDKLRWNHVADMVIGCNDNDSKFYRLTGYVQNDGTRYTTQEAEWEPIIFGEKAVYVARLGMRVKAQPIVSNIPPTIKVEWGTNGSTLTESKYFDLSKDALATNFTDQEISVPIYIPIARFVTDVRLKVSSVNNTASITNGIEIYDLWADVGEGDDVNEKGRLQADKGDLAGS